MFAIACMWWMIEKNQGSPGVSLAIFLILTALPSLILVNYIGKKVETINPIKILKRADLTGFLLSLILIGSYVVNSNFFLILLAVTFFYSTCQAFIEPTLQKAVNHIVEEKDVPTAIAFLSTTQTVAYFAGAVLGALLINLMDLEGIIALNALAYLGSFILDSSLQLKEKDADEPNTLKAEQQNDEQLTSIQVLKKLPLIRKILFGFAAVNFLSVPTLLLIPLYTQKSLGGDSQLLALNEACIWLGLIAGSYLGRILVDKTTALGATAFLTTLFGVSLTIPGFIVNTWVYMISLFLVGLSVGTMNVRIVTYFQLNVKDHLKGRFFSVLKATVSFLTPVGYAVFGLLSISFSPEALTKFQGLGVVVISSYFFYLLFDQAKHTSQSFLASTSEKDVANV